MDLIELDAALRQNAHDRRRQGKLQGDLVQVDQQISATQDRIQQWRIDVRKAEGQLRDLDSPSIGYFFGSLFGDRQDRIDDQKDRLAKQRLGYDEAVAALEPLQLAKQQAEVELASLGDPTAREAELLRTKDRVLQELGEALGVWLLDSGRRLGEWQHQHREIQEAIDAAKNVIVELRQATAHLEQAASWGVTDIIGLDLIGGVGKYSRIGKATERMHAAQQRMRHLDRELRDVTQFCSAADGIELPLVHIGGFATMADYFFDGLVADWFVQSRIRTTRRRIEEAIREVHALAHEMWKVHQSLGDQIGALDAEREARIRAAQAE